MLRSIATVSLSGGLPEKMQAAAAAGFDGIEIFESDLLSFSGAAGELKRMAADLGLAIMLFQPFRDFEAVPRERMARNLARAERKLDLMLELGAPLMLVCSNVAPDTLNDRALMSEDLRALAEMAAQRDLRIGYEALAWGRHVRDWRSSWQIVRDADHPSLGLILDSFHVLAAGDDLDGFDRAIAAKLFFVQIADAPRLRMDVLEWSRHFRVFPGQGEFDLVGFTAPILRAGYAGPLSLEIFNDDFRAAPPRATAEDGLRSLLFLEDATRRTLADERALPALFAPPSAPIYRGWEFLEFAVDEDSGERLERCLRALGFRCAGSHRSKRVELYRQGAVNLILNYEPESFARSYFLLHGPSVCATGLAVDHAEAALARAVAFRWRSFAGGVGPNESRIPSIRAPDGSLVYFVEHAGDGEPRDGQGIYTSDFSLDPAPPGDTSLTHIDHVSLGVPDGQYGTWLLFYKAALGFTADADWVLPDPYGLIKSRVVRSVNGAVRIPLNISESRNTAIARSISSYGGAGVQHIAFACDNIFTVQATLAAAGTCFLPIPAHYYDDLAGKFGLSEDFAARLAAQNILYDRDAEGGEFFHCYTEVFDNRFVFEVLERRSYQQYGAANAPVRLAALAARQERSPYQFNALEF